MLLHFLVPLVELKQRELELKAMDLKRKSTEGMMNYDLKENQIEEKLDIEKMKLERTYYSKPNNCWVIFIFGQTGVWYSYCVSKKS